MPRHPRVVHDRQRIAHVVIHLLEVHNARIVVILAGEQRLGEVGRVHISEGVRMRIPASEAEIEAADSGILVINSNDLPKRLEWVMCGGAAQERPSRDGTRIRRCLSHRCGRDGACR
jgi:hypothetical protein